MFQKTNKEQDIRDSEEVRQARYLDNGTRSR